MNSTQSAQQTAGDEDVVADVMQSIMHPYSSFGLAAPCTYSPGQTRDRGQSQMQLRSVHTGFYLTELQVQPNRPPLLRTDMLLQIHV